MILPSLLRGVALPAGAVSSAGPSFAASVERDQEIEERAVRLKRQRLIDDALAIRVAHFSVSGWARRYPVPAHDLGLDCAVYIVDHLLAHAVDTEDAMHDALERYRVEMAIGGAR